MCSVCCEERRDNQDGPSSAKENKLVENNSQEGWVAIMNKEKEIEIIKRKILGNNPVELEWNHCGLPCMVLMTSLGHRCGYVGVPKDSPLYGMDYDNNKLREVMVHGGLTYSNNMSTLSSPYITMMKNVSDYWWFGFDCGHSGDGRDLKTALKYFMGTEQEKEIKNLIDFEHKYSNLYNGSVKTTDYCADSCNELAEQLAKIEKDMNDTLSIVPQI